MSVKVPRAPRAADAPDALARVNRLRARLESRGRSPMRRESSSLGPAICVFAGTGLIFIVVAMLVEAMPSSPLAQLLVAVYASLPFGG